uniref:Uncharacterized protein n=1 Tax=Arundo donax TaxID=35708 RepID=A0A0A9GV68_ARUDO
MAGHCTSLELFQTKAVVYFYSPFQIDGPVNCTLHACFCNLHHPFLPPFSLTGLQQQRRVPICPCCPLDPAM